MQEIVYEAYGPGGTAYVIECISDNRNRTSANVKVAISKHGGRVADGGSVAWMFDRKGLVVAEVVAGTNIEELELELIDFGAEDFSVGDTIINVVTAPTGWNKIRDILKQKGGSILSAGLSYIPKQKVPIADEATAKKVGEFIEAIEEDEDVSDVHTNADVQVTVTA